MGRRSNLRGTVSVSHIWTVSWVPIPKNTGNSPHSRHCYRVFFLKYSKPSSCQTAKSLGTFWGFAAVPLLPLGAGAACITAAAQRHPPQPGDGGARLPGLTDAVGSLQPSTGSSATAADACGRLQRRDSHTAHLCRSHGSRHRASEPTRSERCESYWSDWCPTSVLPFKWFTNGKVKGVKLDWACQMRPPPIRRMTSVQVSWRITGLKSQMVHHLNMRV